MAACLLAGLTVGDLTVGDLTVGDLTAGDLTAGDQTAGDQTVGDLTVGDPTVGDPMRGAALTTMVPTGVRHAAMTLMAGVGRTTAALADATTNLQPASVAMVVRRPGRVGPTKEPAAVRTAASHRLHRMEAFDHPRPEESRCLETSAKSAAS